MWGEQHAITRIHGDVNRLYIGRAHAGVVLFDYECIEDSFGEAIEDVVYGRGRN
jgi:hypothetical protein